MIDEVKMAKKSTTLAKLAEDKETINIKDSKCPEN